MLKMFKLAIMFTLALAAQDTLPEPSQRTDAPYRLFRTRNTYNFLRLDTRSGLIWHVQWGNESGDRHTYPLNPRQLSDNKKPGRFTLTPTTNFYTFILSDQEDGRQWQIQWSTKPEERLVLPIADESSLAEALPVKGQFSSADITPAKTRAPVPKNGRPIKPKFGELEGETWEQFEAALARYEADHDEWLIAETRRQVQQELAAQKKRDAAKVPVPPRKQP